MTSMIWLTLLLTAAEPATEPADAAVQMQWRRLFDRVAAEYRLVRDEPTTHALTLLERPTYLWARAGEDGGTYGAVYVWTDRGAAEAVGCIWRYQQGNGRQSVVHELHSLSSAVFHAEGERFNTWKPKAGMQRIPVPDAPKPAATAVARMQQMRAMCRDFAAHSVSTGGDRTELRLLPQPLYRYQSTNPEIIDGALFAYVCSVGTDPEVFLLLEAAQTPDGSQWFFVPARFSHMNLFVEYRDQEVWSAVRDAENPVAYNADRTYWVTHQSFQPAMLDDAEKN